MKTYLLPLLAAFALTIGTAAAQTTTPTAAGQMQGRGYGRNKGTPDEMATRQSQRMAKQLDLNADQTTKVQQILLARGQERQAMRGQARDASNRGQLRSQMQASRTKYEAQFREVLTAEQYTKFAAMQDDRMDRGREMKDTRMKAKNGKVKIKKSDS